MQPFPQQPIPPVGFPPPYQPAQPAPPAQPAVLPVAGKPPAARALRTLWQALAAAVVAIPGGILAANAMAEQAGVEWRVPPIVWAAGAGGAGVVFVISAAVNAWDSVKGKG